jgi:hypothetical protein
MACIALLAMTAFSCGKLDVVGSDSIRSFGELLQNAPQLVSEDTANGGWSILAPDYAARFIWSLNDITLEFDAAPFIDAGLDPGKLPAYFTRYDGTLIIGTKLENKEMYNGEITPLAAYEHIVKQKRSAIGYHAAMDHYGVSLENGNLFEWAKDLNTNDKDIVFALDPEPFIRAGADPNNIEGWLFDKVLVDGENGRMIQVDKFLKPFNVKR